MSLSTRLDGDPGACRLAARRARGLAATLTEARLLLDVQARTSPEVFDGRAAVAYRTRAAALGRTTDRVATDVTALAKALDGLADGLDHVRDVLRRVRSIAADRLVVDGWVVQRPGGYATDVQHDLFDRLAAVVGRVREVERALQHDYQAALAAATGTTPPPTRPATPPPTAPGLPAGLAWPPLLPDLRPPEPDPAPARARESVPGAARDRGSVPVGPVPLPLPLPQESVPEGPGPEGSGPEGSVPEGSGPEGPVPEGPVPEPVRAGVLGSPAPESEPSVRPPPPPEAAAPTQPTEPTGSREPQPPGPMLVAETPGATLPTPTLPTAPTPMLPTLAAVEIELNQIADLTWAHGWLADVSR